MRSLDDLNGVVFHSSPEQPPEDLEWVTIDKVFIKIMWAKKAGLWVPQHSHPYEHGTFLFRGAMTCYQEGKLVGAYKAPTLIVIPAETKHTFRIDEDDTMFGCIHNTMRKEIVEILEENHLPMGDH